MEHDIKQFTVLLVEDDLNDVFLVKRAFKMAQLPTPLQVVTDGEKAIDYLRGEGKVCRPADASDAHTYRDGHQDAAQNGLRRAGVGEVP